MTQPAENAAEAVNADSFLDIVASVVSIMIIMVLMIGLKIKHSPVDVAVSEAAAPPTEDSAAQEVERTAGEEVSKARRALEDMRRTAAVRKEECVKLSERLVSLQGKSQAARQELDERSQRGGELTRNLTEAEARLGELEHQRRTVEAAPGPCVQIECRHTPLSRMVEGPELHFQLRHGRVAPIPLDSLVEQLKSDARHKVDRLRDMPEMADTVGPVGGFRLRYTLEKLDRTPERARVAGRGGPYIQVKRWTLMPESEDLGEPVDRALADSSEFRRALAAPLAREATVTVWVYPDSFDAFQQIKKEFYRLGLAVAARPLPEGILISGSPNGSKSAAE